jgi:hypothetical protein
MTVPPDYLPKSPLDMTAHRLEWWIDMLQGKTGECAKRLILEGRSESIAYFSDEQAERLIAALKLKST